MSRSCPHRLLKLLLTRTSCSFFREIAKHLSLPPVKLHCSMLAEDAIKAAVKDYEAKKAKPANADE
jgi:NifU-like protein involved in Fe-S cluster formation